MGPRGRFSKSPTKKMSATDIKLFNKYSFEEVAVSDMALTDYIACKSSSACFLPHSAGRWHKKRFKKAQCPIIVRIMKHTCDIIHLTTGDNPIQVIVDAVVNSGPR